MNTTSCALIGIACVTGMLGDSMLQLGAANGLGGPTGWGLKDYFKQHGRAESIFIAGGMMVIFFLGLIVSNAVSITLLSLAIYGVLLYYEYFNYFWSAVWGAIPMMMPLVIYKIFKN